VLIFNTVIY